MIFYDGIVSTGVWTHTDYPAAFRSYAGTTYWLGRRSSAIDAASHVAQPTDTAGRYVFYNDSTHQVEQLDTATIVVGVDAGTRYHPIALLSAADEPEVLVDTLDNSAVWMNVSIGTSRWTRRTSTTATVKETNQIAFNRQLYPVDDRRLMSFEFFWEELQSGTIDADDGITRRFSATISAGAFRRLVERTYMASGSNRAGVDGSADWYIRRPNYQDTQLNGWAEIRMSYGRFRAAYKTNGIGDDSVLARATAPDGIAFQFGYNGEFPNSTYMRFFRARIELH